jgi:hypothetical protein
MFGRWTAVLLKQHYDAVLRDRDESVERTRRQMELRLDGMNEFRQSLNDLTTRFVTKEELRAARAEFRLTVAVVAAVVTAAVGAVALLR